MTGSAPTPRRTLQAYAAVAGAMLLLDGVWLGALAQPLYARGIGHMMAERPLWGPALAFYAVYAWGLLRFAVRPFAPGAGWSAPLSAAAAFGLVAYGTYDLSNWATLKGWPGWLALLDMAWGTLASTLAVTAGCWAWRRPVRRPAA